MYENYRDFHIGRFPSVAVELIVPLVTAHAPGLLALQALHLLPQLLDRPGLGGDRLRLPGDHYVPGGAGRAVRGRLWQIGHKPP